MKKCVIIILFCGAGFAAFPQAQELQELALDIEKLAQFKQILSDLKKGYEILSGGYTTIKNISEGNFSLHKSFLDGLMAVSPAVARYKKIAAITTNQLQLVKEYKNAYRRFKQDDNFSPGELEYIGRVYSNLVKESAENLDALLNIVTANKLRMFDEERLKGIDAIDEEIESKLSFLRFFNNNTSILSVQRTREKNDLKTIRLLTGTDK